MERVDLETVRSAALLSVVPMAGRHLTLASRAFECARPRRQRPAAPAVVAAIDPRHRPLCVEARGRAVLLCGAAPPKKEITHTHTHTRTHSFVLSRSLRTVCPEPVLANHLFS